MDALDTVDTIDSADTLDTLETNETLGSLESRDDAESINRCGYTLFIWISTAGIWNTNKSPIRYL